MKFYNIAIYTHHSIEINRDDVIILDGSYSLIDSFKAKKDNQEIIFDYLITDSLEALSFLGCIIDNGFALTNSSFQTTIENTFAFGKAINTSISEKETLEEIFDTIYE